MNNKMKDKTYTIIINTRDFEYDDKKISFKEVVELAFGSYVENDKIIYTVTYSRGEHGKEGSLVVGQDVRVKDGMVFDVTQSNRS